MVSLAEDLGLSNELPEGDFPELDKVMRCLRVLHNEWDWREEPDPYNLSGEFPKDLNQPGIYNRTIIMLAERSPYTRGLEAELVKLQSVPESVYGQTALGSWLRGNQLSLLMTKRWT